MLKPREVAALLAKLGSSRSASEAHIGSIGTLTVGHHRAVSSTP